MLISPILIVTLVAIGVAMIMIGAVFATKDPNKKKERSKRFESKYGLLSTKGMIDRLNNSQVVEDFGARFGSSKKLDALFRKSKNPWNMTPFTFNFIRFGISGAALLIGIVILVFVDWSIALIFFAIAGLCFILPKKQYEDIARSRENQWNQIYQFIWVIKHNLNYYDPKKMWFETEKYVKDHTSNLPEVEEGLRDFAIHWNGESMDEYIRETYGDFSIPKDLFNVVLNSQLTGEYPNNELNSLRTIIIEKMRFTVQEILSVVGSKATMASAPFLLASVALVILVPVILTILEAFV